MVYVDFEMNTPCHHDVGEVIQIGACRVDGRKIVDRFKVTLNLQKDECLDWTVSILTGIVQADIDEGVSFKCGLQQFYEWVNKDKMCVYGCKDKPSVLYSISICDDLSVEEKKKYSDFITSSMIDLSPLINKEMGGSYPIKLYAAAEQLKVRNKGIEHDPVNDAEVLYLVHKKILKGGLHGKQN